MHTEDLETHSHVPAASARGLVGPRGVHPFGGAPVSPFPPGGCFSTLEILCTAERLDLIYPLPSMTAPLSPCSHLPCRL